MKRDLLQQAYGAMRHDVRKTVMTMLGMAWGIATVVLLLAYGEGFGHAIQAIWDSYGSTAVGIYPGRTSQQAGGNKAGVAVHFTEEDVELISNVVPLVKHVSRCLDRSVTAQAGPRSFSLQVFGIDPGIQDIWNLGMESGRFVDDQDTSSTLIFSIGSGERKRCSNMAPVRRLRSFAWMNARRLPGVRCSTLKTECRSLLCLMIMPGRSWVAGIAMCGNALLEVFAACLSGANQQEG
jgi:hypothetical protein